MSRSFAALGPPAACMRLGGHTGNSPHSDKYEVRAWLAQAFLHSAYRVNMPRLEEGFKHLPVRVNGVP